MVEHGCLPVSEGVEVDAQQPWVLEFPCDVGSLLLEDFADRSEVLSEDPAFILDATCSLKVDEHIQELPAYLEDARVASLLRRDPHRAVLKVHISPSELMRFSSPHSSLF